MAFSLAVWSSRTPKLPSVTAPKRPTPSVAARSNLPHARELQFHPSVPMTDDNPQVDEPADPGGTAPFAALYDRAVESLLDVPVREEYLETERGRTHLLTAGNQSAPPVVVFQGGNVTNPVTLSRVQGLADEYHLIAPDTPGQPGKTTVEEPRKFASWVVGLLDGLDLEDSAMIGISHGAGIVLEAAAEVPDRIDAAALVVPAGFGTSVSVEFVRMASPSLAYRFLPGQGFLRRGLAPMFTRPMSTVDGAIIETVETVLRTGDPASEFPGPDTLRRWRASGARRWSSRPNGTRSSRGSVPATGHAGPPIARGVFRARRRTSLPLPGGTGPRDRTDPGASRCERSRDAIDPRPPALCNRQLDSLATMPDQDPPGPVESCLPQC